MIQLTKLSRQTIILNDEQIQYIEFIPETKVTMMNGEYILVQEGKDEIVDRIIAFRRTIESGDHFRS